MTNEFPIISFAKQVKIDNTTVLQKALITESEFREAALKIKKSGL